MILVLEAQEAREYLCYLAAHRKTVRPHFVAGGEHLDGEIRESKRQAVIRPQTSGPCVHIDQADDKDPEAVQALGLACQHPGRAYQRDDECPQEWECPHMDTPEILCPVRDACYAMREAARMQEACEVEQTEQDTDMTAEETVYETTAPEWVEPEPDDGALHTYTVPATRKPTNPNAWSDEEIEVIRRAQSADEAGRLYSETYGIWKRSRSAVTSRWYKLRAAGELIAPAPTPDFVGDTAPVTQCDEDPVFAVPRPAYRPGDGELPRRDRRYAGYDRPHRRADGGGLSGRQSRRGAPATPHGRGRAVPIVRRPAGAG